jgi:hypothetical protein
MHIFLDDIRSIRDIYHTAPNPEQWIVIRNYNDFVKEIQREFPEFVSFDHDLADEHYHALIKSKGNSEAFDIDSKNFKEKTGLECAKWLVNYCMEKDVDFPDYAVHSFNPIGAENIRCYIEGYKKFRLEN